jgi:hypothetical protein
MEIMYFERLEEKAMRECCRNWKIGLCPGNRLYLRYVVVVFAFGVGTHSGVSVGYDVNLSHDHSAACTLLRRP